jgi:putative transcriptional regulator
VVVSIPTKLPHLRPFQEMNCDLHKFGDCRGLAFHRHRKQITQAALAQRCGLSRQFINVIEAGSAQPNVQVALHLAEVLECSVEDLFSRMAPKK